MTGHLEEESQEGSEGDDGRQGKGGSAVFGGSLRARGARDSRGGTRGSRSSARSGRSNWGNDGGAEVASGHGPDLERITFVGSGRARISGDNGGVEDARSEGKVAHRRNVTSIDAGDPLDGSIGGAADGRGTRVVSLVEATSSIEDSETSVDDKDVLADVRSEGVRIVGAAGRGVSTASVTVGDGSGQTRSQVVKGVRERTEASRLNTEE